MAIDDEDADNHINIWEERLARESFPHRKNWPSRLFHHCPIENAVGILESGFIRSRNDPDNPLYRNIAGDGVIDNRDNAHNHVRLYFRPKTPTQFHIEGIRKAEECEEFGHQAPILIMLLFEAKPLLTRDGTLFSQENMQKTGVEASGGLEFFNTIPFDKVFHEGGLNGDRSIISHRCAEVLLKSPLDINQSLQWIYCRSEAERDTLLFKLGDVAPNFSKKIRVSDDIKVFNRLLTYVEHVHLSRDGLVFEIHPRNDGKNISLEISVTDEQGNIVAQLQNPDFRPYPPSGKRWIMSADLHAGTYGIQFRIENEEAYLNELSIGDTIL